MLARRIIPTVLMRGGQAVKGQGFNSWRNVGQVRMTVRVHQSRQVDELVLLDISGRLLDLGLVRDLAGDCFFPLTVGGGVRTVADGLALLRAGADKVSVGSHALDAGLIEGLTEKLGSQSVVVSLDVKDGTVWINGGKLNSNRSAVEVARECANRGAGELLVTSIPRDGTLIGYDLELIADVAAAVSIPVIAAGGAGLYKHLADGLDAGAHAVAAGAMWAFTDQTPQGAADYLGARGYHVRTHNQRAMA